MTDANAARRERAEKYLSSIHIFSSEEILWARRAAPGDEFGEGWLVGYLAGSREEAAIKDAEIGRLESLLDRARPLARKNLEQAAEIEELKAEIAALREYVRWRETGGERRMEPLSTEAINAFGRAMEETP